ncbi:aspartate/tyrosine/aromatic aminotransferase [Caldisphaera lagunensis DSM 15908]|uniref:Aspartate/tyrosine/aromatic aminotransferase n=1 Tax=Caldisphaera lagunensis (strain DSM 15908 / JCM 11604 / ANMR 0165 / IC-154) TaxID=1056495 RepID=L0A7X1_CALLD|nr:pyridoxal phosphate-dependent aminotransferase [Caldisphaera lagunensis]AFZ69931.1 aspartate/tyrosine/aromatic aminotransferase [Caldisphaera lagunensis DSM 15908]
MIQFEIGKYLEQHKVKYNLSNSGMSDVIDISKYFKGVSIISEEDLKKEIAEVNGDKAENVVITHGATEAFFLTAYYLYNKGLKKAKFPLPEYELIRKIPEALGMEIGEGDIYMLSNPNNPTGQIMELEPDYKAYIVDETFMEFYRNLDKSSYPENTFRINTFTKFYGGDELRVGYIITPSKEDAEKIDNFRGILTDRVSRYNMSVAYKILKDRENIRKTVREIQKIKLDILLNKRDKLEFFKGRIPVLGTISFMDYSNYTKIDSKELTEKLIDKSILVVPSSYFGINGPYMRVCYSSKNFEEGYGKLKEALNEFIY